MVVVMMMMISNLFLFEDVIRSDFDLNGESNYNLFMDRLFPPSRQLPPS